MIYHNKIKIWWRDFGEIQPYFKKHIVHLRSQHNALIWNLHLYIPGSSCTVMVTTWAPEYIHYLSIAAVGEFHTFTSHFFFFF